MKASILFGMLAIICGWLPAQHFYLPVNQGMKWGAINEKGELKIPFRYKQVYPSHFGGILPYVLIKSEEGFGVFHTEKGEIIAGIYEDITYGNSPFFESYFICKKEGKTTIVDLDGRSVFSHSYAICVRLDNGNWVLGNKGKVGIWKNGDDTLRDFPYENIKLLNASLLEITQGGKRFLARMDGNPCFGKTFRYINRMNDKWLVGTRSDGSDIFNLAGEHLLSFQDTFIHELTQSHISYVEDIEMKIGQMYGLMDWQKNVLTPAICEAHAFDPAGYIWVNQNNLWGVLDDAGKTIFPPTFSRSSRFGKLLAVVQVGDRVGLLNKSGEMIAEPKYNRIQVFEDMARLLKDDGNWQQVPFDTLGRPIRRMRLYVAGRSAQQDVSAENGAIKEEQVYNNLGWFHKKGYWAWKHPRTGEFVIKGNIRAVHPLPEKGISIVAREYLDGRKKILRYGVVDHRRGRWLTKPIFTHIHTEDFEQGGVARITQATYKRGLINRRGQVKIFNGVAEIRPFYHGLAVVTFRNHKLAILRENGTWARPFVQTEITELTDFKEGVAVFKTNGKWGVVDSALQIKILATYNWLYKIPGTELYKVSQTTSMFRYYTQSGKFLFEVNASQSGEVHEGKMWVRNKEGKYAFYDTTGKEVIPFGLSKASDFQEGLAAVAQRGHGWGFIDESGKWVMDRFGHAKPFGYGLAPVRQRRRYGYIDKEGNWLVPPRLRVAYSFQAPGLAVVRKKRRYGVIDTLGNYVLNMRFRRMEIGQDYILAKPRGEAKYFDGEGKRIDAPQPQPITEKQAKGDPVDVVEKHLEQLEVGNTINSSNGVWVCYKSEIFGMINSKGEVVVPVEYDNIKVAVKGKAYTLFKHGKRSYVDHNGAWIYENE